MSSIMRGNLRMAIAGVRSAKWRSLLTMLGVIVGIVAVVTIVSIGDGVKHQVAGQLSQFGPDLITVRPGSPNKINSASEAAKDDALFGMGTSTGLSLHDTAVIAKAPHVKSVTPLGVVPGTIQVNGKTFTNNRVIATSRSLPDALNHRVAYGEFWDDMDQSAYTAVIGRNVADNVFGEPVPLGRTLIFRGQRFLIRGVFSDFNSAPLSPTATFDDAIFIPADTASKITQDSGNYYVALAKSDSASNMPTALDGITADLKQAHGGQQDFAVLSPEQNIANSSELVRTITMWITAIAAISLFIGGVGIMNIMLLSVSERMHEIGVRKAVGATSRQILGQFVLEASVLSVVGGAIGIVLSLATVGLLYAYTDLKPVVSWQALAIATGVSLAIGIVFGAVPAAKAASKDPIEALRHE